MRLWQLTAGRSKHAYLVDVEAKFRCQRCSDDFRPYDFDEL